MKKNIWKIVLIYAFVAALWIFCSDRLLGIFVATPDRLVEWSTAKGILFVVITAAMLFALISRFTSQLSRASNAWIASERKFRTLFEKINDGIAVVELETLRLHLANPALCQMLGYTKEEISQLKVSDIHPRDDLPRVMKEFERESLGQATIAMDLPVMRKDGKIFFADINAIGIELDGKRYVLGVFRDVTARKRVESDLQQAKEAAETASRAKDQFIAVLSHELRTPLMPALATVMALQGETDLPHGMGADLQIVRRNLEMEAHLINDLLDVTRISRGQIQLHFEKVDLHDCLKGAVEICRTQIVAKQLKIETRLDAASSFVWGDPPRLQQIFWNLLSNAVKFTPFGGSIDVHSDNSGTKVRIEIADTGIGIDPETLPRLFHPFEQGEQTMNRRFGGLGLGLSLAKNLVGLHRGSLVATSAGRDQGTVFVVELSTVTAVPQPPPPVTAPLLATDPAAKILLVDDHSDTLRILSRLLKKWSYSVETADSVQSALKLAAKQKFDLLISDLGLPDGSGREIMAEVKERYGLQGIALSGFGTEEDVQASLSAGFEEHFVKPVSFPDLQAALKRILAGQRR